MGIGQSNSIDIVIYRDSYLLLISRYLTVQLYTAIVLMPKFWLNMKPYFTQTLRLALVASKASSAYLHRSNTININ